MRKSPVHPIEQESYRLLNERVDLSSLSPLVREVVSRVVHATADLGFVESMVVSESACQAGLDALASGAPVVTDVEMVRAAIPGSMCFLGEARRHEPLHDGATRAGESPGEARTLSARAIDLAITAYPTGAIFAIGCAPTALEALVDAIAAGRAEPALVIGTPVGFVGASESKEHLRLLGERVPHISNVGERGGSAVAAAVVNALSRLR
jgi:precorrin isomerase